MPSDKFESFKITDEALKGIGWATEGLQPQGPTREEYSQLNLKLNSSGTNDGKLFFVNNPQNTFAVYPPLNGCGGGLFTAAESAKGRCLITTNGGYFETRGKQGCHGTIISDGETVNFREETNVSFGVTEEGHIVIGYLTEEEKKEQKFKQLINGVVWIVRNGTNYVTESIRQEDMSIQETSSCPTADDCAFRSVKAGRVLLGHDKTGRIMIMAINGFKGNAGGVSLDEAAALMIDAGAVNAINMDGGGSATVFSGDTLISSPSDDCGIRGFDVPIQHSCVRNVTSVLCIKPNYPVLPPSSSNDVLLVTGKTFRSEISYFIIFVILSAVVFSKLRKRWSK